MSFTDDLRRFTQKASSNMDEIIRTTIIEIGDKILDRSPVGDATAWKSSPPPGYVGGRFRGSWHYSFGSASISEEGVIDPSGSASRDRIQKLLFQSPTIGVHFLTNNMPYAQRLEDGWSTQAAPQGIVGLTVLEGPGIVESVARRVNR